jgi:hypothetical protein
MASPYRRRSALFAIFAITLAANAAVPADPWTLVPALPTACYGQQDDFDEVLATRIETLSAEISRQTQLNDQLDARVDTLDPQEKQRRILDYMAKNPQDAAKAMQALQSLGSGAAAAHQEETEDEGEQRQALTGLFARYDAALKAATDPIFVKRNKISDMASNPEFGVLSAQLDREYEKLCPQWWKGGPFRTWLAGYRQFLVQGIPGREEKEAKGNAHYAMFGISTATYRSTVKMEAVKKYLMRTQEIYGRRHDQPFWN